MIELSESLPPIREPVASDSWAVSFAMILVGMARNGRLPPLVTEEELRWRGR
jgi:hypothetical protein